MQICHPDGREITTHCDGRCYCHGLPVTFGETDGCCNNCGCPKSTEAFERFWKKIQEEMCVPETPKEMVRPSLGGEVHPTERCGLCNGLGIVEDPHHGHAMRCERCNGTGEAK